MRLKLRISVMCLFMLVAGNFNNLNHAASGPAKSPNSGFNLLVTAKGKVKVRRQAWSDYHPVSFGTILYRGDLIKAEKGAEAVILCDNLTKWTVPYGAPSGLNNGCPPPHEPLLKRPGGRIVNTRGDNNPLIPYIISPRSTKLLNNTPTLHWNAVSDKARYTVNIWGNDFDWHHETVENKIAYSGKTPLKPGVDYQLVVKADNGRSSQEEGRVGLGFRLLSEQESQYVRDAEELIKKINLSDKAKSFALALLYAGHELSAEAVEILETMVREGSQSSAVYRNLGDYYRKLGLTRFAEKRYSKAVEFAKTEQDIEGEAMAHAGLGEVYAILGNAGMAKEWLKLAKYRYKSLGDIGHMKEIEERIVELR